MVPWYMRVQGKWLKPTGAPSALWVSPVQTRLARWTDLGNHILVNTSLQDRLYHPSHPKPARDASHRFVSPPPPRGKSSEGLE